MINAGPAGVLPFGNAAWLDEIMILGQSGKQR